MEAPSEIKSPLPETTSIKSQSQIVTLIDGDHPNQFQRFECTLALAQLLGQAALIGMKYDPKFPVCFSSIFYSFLVCGDPVSRWLRAYLRQERVDSKNFFRGDHSFDLEQLNNLPLENWSPHSSGWVRSWSANAIINKADEYRRDLKEQFLEVHHLMAANIYDPAGHHDIEEWKINRTSLSNYFLGYIETHQPRYLEYYKNIHADKFLEQPQLQYIYPVVGYKSDQPNGADLLNISSEVNALASLIASNEIRPPLSIGLFGEWGSGKSFFMEKLKERIQIVSHKSNMNGYCKNIIAISFNAWHYSEVCLWSSLNSEIFEQLAQTFEKREEKDVLAFQRLLTAASTRDVLAETERKQKWLEEQLLEEEARYTKCENTLTILKAVIPEAFNVVIKDPEISQKLQTVAKSLHLSDNQAQETITKIWTEGKGLFRKISILIGSGNHLILLMALVAFTLFSAGFGWLLPQLLNLGFDQVFKWLIGLGTGFVGFIGTFLNALRKINDIIQESQRRMDAIKQDNIKESELQKQISDAKARVNKLKTQLDELNVESQMVKFIQERQKSTEYTQQLGVIARAHRDFKRLSELLDKVREEAEVEKGLREKGETNYSDKDKLVIQELQAKKLPLPRIDRIVLCIDDLDRCPEDKVVDVLQAIHLMLAFPLFVVVVGVDPRWLLHSLKQRLKVFQNEQGELDGLSENQSAQWESTPLDYLEKIFQIPFTLRPVSEDGFDALINDLTGEKEVKDNDQETKNESKENILNNVNKEAAASKEGTSRGGDSISGLKNHSDQLKIQPAEQDFMKKLYTFIPTPRAVKRYVNIYRLIRAMALDNSKVEFISNDDKGPYQVVLLLLALQTGYPSQAAIIFRELVEKTNSNVLWSSVMFGLRKWFTPTEIVENSNPPTNEEKDYPYQRLAKDSTVWKEIFEKLDSVADLIPDKTCEELQMRVWVPEVARFSFQPGYELLNQPKGDAQSRMNAAVSKI